MIFLYALTLLLFSAVAEAQVQVPVLLHMARENGADVAPEAFIQDQLEHANTIYRPLGLELVIAGRRAMALARMITREDRDALGPQRVAGVVNWFVVAQLMDVDEPGRERRGVHWHLRASPRVRYVIVSAIAGPWVLSHELGHFFGNPNHSQVAGNLMSYDWSLPVPFLDDAQQANVARTVRGMRARGELLTLQKAKRNLRSFP
jgi:hypothetical protein